MFNIYFDEERIRISRTDKFSFLKQTLPMTPLCIRQVNLFTKCSFTVREHAYLMLAKHISNTGNSNKHQRIPIKRESLPNSRKKQQKNDKKSKKEKQTGRFGKNENERPPISNGKALETPKFEKSRALLTTEGTPLEAITILSIPEEYNAKKEIMPYTEHCQTYHSPLHKNALQIPRQSNRHNHHHTEENTNPNPNNKDTAHKERSDKYKKSAGMHYEAEEAKFVFKGENNSKHKLKGFLNTQNKYVKYCGSGSGKKNNQFDSNGVNAPVGGINGINEIDEVNAMNELSQRNVLHEFESDVSPESQDDFTSPQIFQTDGTTPPHLKHDKENFIRKSTEPPQKSVLYQQFFNEILFPSALYKFKIQGNSNLRDHPFAIDKRKITQEIDYATFLDSYYELPSLDILNDWILCLESLLKEFYSTQGSETVLLEAYIFQIFQYIFIENDIDQGIKILCKIRDLLYNCFSCPPEIVIMVETVSAILFENRNQQESEVNYIMAMIGLNTLYGDPRGRGNVGIPLGLLYAWKLELSAKAESRMHDSEFAQEIYDSILFSLNGQTKKRLKKNILEENHRILNNTNSKQSQIGSQNQNIAVDNILYMNDISMGLENQGFGDKFESALGKEKLNTIYKYISQNFKTNELENIQVPFMHWSEQNTSPNQLVSFQENLVSSPIAFYNWLIRHNLTMAQSSLLLNNKQIKDFIFTRTLANSPNLNLSQTSNMTNLISNPSILSTPTSKERRNAIQGSLSQIFSKEAYGFSKSDLKGVLYIWGTDNYGQLGLSLSCPQEIMYKAGKVRYPRLQIPLKDLVVKEIACGHRHSIAMTSYGVIYAWGCNESFQLGIGTHSPSIVKVPTVVQGIADVYRITCGSEHSVALTKSGKVFSWGQGDGGLLGHGTNNSCAVPTLIQQLEVRVWGGGVMCFFRERKL
jgi:hypothetical protein